MDRNPSRLGNYTGECFSSILTINHTDVQRDYLDLYLHHSQLVSLSLGRVMFQLPPPVWPDWVIFYKFLTTISLTSILVTFWAISNNDSYVKSVWLLFGQFWGEIRQLFIPTSGLTDHHLESGENCKRVPKFIVLVSQIL